MIPVAYHSASSESSSLSFGEEKMLSNAAKSLGLVVVEPVQGILASNSK